MSYGINMDHCKFENTYKALQQCLQGMGDENFLEELSRDEKSYLLQMANLFEEYQEHLEDMDLV